MAGDPLTGRDRVAGCLLGGAVGDALGAPVEFLCLSEIRARFGPEGIRGYAPAYGRLGAITDDTQMTLFTAEGLIRARQRHRERGICKPAMVIWHAYLRWLGTQGIQRFDPELPAQHDGWLYERPEPHSRRAPGNTCLSALESGEFGTVERPLNTSKGCGGVMRLAPVGLIADELFKVGCETAAITHGYPTGYLAAGFLAHLIAALVRGRDLDGAIAAAREELRKWHDHEDCLAAVDGAVHHASRACPTAEEVEELGAGWVAEEALAISLFCALRADDFAYGLRLAVNHSGDSDSTGAITGSILGCLWGRSSIPDAMLADLELRDVIEELSSDLLGSQSSQDHRKYPTW